MGCRLHSLRRNAPLRSPRVFTAIIRPFLLLVKNRELLKVMTARLWLSRGKGGALHLLWPLITPAIMLIIYYFAFGVILNLRNLSSGSDYALEMFCGMAVFNLFAETVNASAYSLTSQANLVKKAVFDLEVIPLATTGCAAISGVLYLVVVLAASLFGGGIGAEIVKLPPLFVSYLFFCAGFAFLVSSLSVFISDLPMLLPLFTQALFFLTPIIYPRSIVPQNLLPVIDLNPLTAFVCAIRDSILNTGAVPPAKLLTLFILGPAGFLIGYAFFAKTKKGFPDVL